jgi:hypothetical protein
VLGIMWLRLARAWAEAVPQVLQAYNAAAPTALTPQERTALNTYTAAIPLYFLALAGFNRDPAGQVRDYEPFLRLSEWLLAQESLP